MGDDGLFGNDYSLMDGLDELILIGVLDVHSDQHVFLEEPVKAIPEKKGNKGRKATKYKTTSKAIEVRTLKKQLEEKGDQFEEVEICEGTKGLIKSKVAVVIVYTWDGKSLSSKKRLLLIRISKTDKVNDQIRYALCNAKEGQFTSKEIVKMQAQRCFVESAFKESKSDISMSEYQVKSWKAWHHHMAMCMMAQAYVLTEKKAHQKERPY